MSRISNGKVNSELFSLEPTALLEFFVIAFDYIENPDDNLYIHGGTNGIEGPVYWQGQEYSAFPIQSSGFESKGDGTLPRPKLTVSNQDFFISNLIRRYSNLVGAKVIRKRTFVKFLDNRNFSDSKNPYGSADPDAGLEDQVFFILRRSVESRSIVEFELSSPLELENVTFPRRTVMSRYCSFHYRGNGCRYLGGPVADENNAVLTKAIDFKTGLLRRKYSAVNGDNPSTSAELTTKIAAGTFAVEDIVSSVSVVDENNYYYEYAGYFKVDAGQAGEYEFGVDPDDSAELFMNGRVIASRYSGGPQNAAESPPVLEPLGTTGKIFLQEGYNRMLIRFHERTGTQGLILYYKTPSASSPNWVGIPTTRYYYDPAELGALTSSERFYSFLNLKIWIGLRNNSLNNTLNRGKWVLNETYKVGEFVYVENKNIKVAKKDINASPNWEPLHKVYICAENHTSSASKSPFFNKQYWVADQCSKNIDGCKLRFGNESSLPFGGFPGTEEYSIQ